MLARGTIHGWPAFKVATAFSDVASTAWLRFEPSAVAARCSGADAAFSYGGQNGPSRTAEETVTYYEFYARPRIAHLSERWHDNRAHRLKRFSISLSGMRVSISRRWNRDVERSFAGSGTRDASE